MLDLNPLVYLKYLSIHKIYNGLKVFSSFHLSRLLGKTIVWGKPYMLNLEPTNFCNLKCIECPTGMDILKRPKGNLTLDDFKSYIDQVKKDLIYLVLYFQGEPFINKQLIEMIQYAANNKIFVQVSTNGHFFNTDEECRAIINSGLGGIILSMDGIEEESYLKYRVNGRFQTVKEGFKRLSTLKKNMNAKFPRTYLQFLVLKHNEHEIDKINDFGKEIGVDKVVLKSAQVYNFDDIDDILPENPKYRRYQQNESGDWQLAGDMRNSCYKLWSDSLWTWDGQVAPCCFDKDVDFKLGDLKENGFDNIWKSKKYNNFRDKVLKNRKEIPMCTNCTEGIKIYRK
jgi:radical SAM protein with 4Fe4S-binding SPASM domain